MFEKDVMLSVNSIGLENLILYFLNSADNLAFIFEKMDNEFDKIKFSLDANAGYSKIEEKYLSLKNNYSKIKNNVVSYSDDMVSLNYRINDWQRKTIHKTGNDEKVVLDMKEQFRIKEVK